MLTLTRRSGEKIVIGSNGEIVITVAEIRGDKVRLGIDAPKDVPVHREEVYHAIQEEKQRQAPPSTEDPDQKKPPKKKKC